MPLHPSVAPGLGLPPASQMGFVVRDMGEALKQFDPLFGPFEVVEFENHGFEYHGVPEDCELRVAWGWSGDVEIELLQPLSGKSPHRDFIESGREGFHHLQYRLDDVAPIEAKLAAAGATRIWGRRSGNYAFAYWEGPAFPFVLELVAPKPRVHAKHTEKRIVIK